MKYTNVNNLPQGIVNAVKRISEEYTKGDADFSCSGLNTPPQIAWLTRAYGDSLTTDVSKEIWKLFGSAMHNILDQSSDVSLKKLAEFRANQLADISNVMSMPTDPEQMEMIAEVLSREEPKRTSSLITEERFYGKIGSYTISGKPDWYDTETKRVEDYKTTSVWKIVKNDYFDWEAQLNIYRWLLVTNGYEVEELQINAILKDWKKHEISRSERYPKFPTVIVPIKKWDLLDTVQYVLDRVRLHTETYKIGSVSKLAEKFPCSSDDKWSKPTVYAVKKVGNKKASFTFSTAEEADTKCNKLGDAYKVEVRPGVDTRCVEWCAVRDYCAQYKEEHNKQTVKLPNDDLTQSAKEFTKENNVKLPVKPTVKVAPPSGSVKDMLEDLGL